MKKLLIITTIFLSSLLMASVVHAKWTKVAESEVGNIYYVDLERIKKHNGRVYYWELADFLKPTKIGVISVKTYLEAEWGRFRYRGLNVTFYKGSMGSGEIFASSNKPKKEWFYPEPYSMVESVLKAVCNHKTMQ